MCEYSNEFWILSDCLCNDLYRKALHIPDVSNLRQCQLTEDQVPRLIRVVAAAYCQEKRTQELYRHQQIRVTLHQITVHNRALVMRSSSDLLARDGPVQAAKRPTQLRLHPRLPSS